MTNQLPPDGNGAAIESPRARQLRHLADIKRSLLRDIRLKWGKFTENDLLNLASNEDLVSHVIAKYGLEKDRARHEVAMLRAGRDI